jgi:hypothetical protein
VITSLQQLGLRRICRCGGVQVSDAELVEGDSEICFSPARPVDGSTLVKIKYEIVRRCEMQSTEVT